MEYIFENDNDAEHVWLPVPIVWDGKLQKQVDIIEMHPEPISIYKDSSSGTKIAYWNNAADKEVFKILFNIELDPASHFINEHQSWPDYDKDSELYIKNTMPTLWAQSDSEQIIELANSITHRLDNPYTKAKAIFDWISTQQWRPPDHSRPDALSFLNSKQGDCGGFSNLFVALCRAAGIPARNISGLHPIAKDSFPLGEMHAFNGLGSHVWAEFYLPDYGWVQCDPASGMFSFTQERVITSKGNRIVLGNGYNLDYQNAINGERSHFHIPCTPGQETMKLVVSDTEEIKNSSEYKLRYEYEITIDPSSENEETYTDSLWIPIPNKTNYQYNIKAIEIEPKPSKIYTDPKHNNSVLYYQNAPSNISGIYEYTRKSFFEYSVDTKNIEEYDKNSTLYKLYTKNETWIESEALEIVNLAHDLTSTQDNFYLKAKEINKFVYEYLEPKAIEWTNPDDFLQEYGALETYKRGYGTCQNYALLFVALCRAAGIPARTVHGTYFPKDRLGKDFMQIEVSHAWAEFYLPGYGWVNVDPSQNEFAEMSNFGIVYSVGNNIKIDPPFYERNEWYTYEGKAMFLGYPVPFFDMRFKITNLGIDEKSSSSSSGCFVDTLKSDK